MKKVLLYGCIVILLFSTATKVTAQILPTQMQEPAPTPPTVIQELLKFFEVRTGDPGTRSTSSPDNSGEDGVTVITTPEGKEIKAWAPITKMRDLYEEIEENVGVPVKILEAVFFIESPALYKSFTEDQIAQYSTPGQKLPQCRPNVCSAIGPMQMTIGTDDKGSTACLACGLRQCPNAWDTYGNAVIKFSKTPLVRVQTADPCNLRDNIYAAAYKLKTDSGATNLQWNQQQVFRAAERYYGSCANKFRYARLDNKTYCEFLWWYFTTK